MDRLSRGYSRREMLKRAGAAGAGALVASRVPDAADGIRVAGRPVEIDITPVSAATVRITVSAIENGTLVPAVADGSLVDRAWPPATARITTLDREVVERAGDLILSTAPDPLGVRITTRDRRPVQYLKIEAATGALLFSLPATPLLGFGEGGPQFDRRGSIDRMRSGQGGYQLRTHGGRVPIQWLIDTSGSAMFVHSPQCSFDLSGGVGRAEPLDPSTALPIDVFIVASSDPATIMREYAALTGLPEMPPLWAFGYQQSHRTLESREAVLAEARTFRDKKLPCDTLIYLGTGFCPSGWNTDNGEFQFNPRVFPDPKAMIDQLHDDHFKVVLHVVLEGRTLRGTVRDACTAAPLPSGRTPDGHWPPDRQAACYWPFHKPVFDLGVDGWWPDQGDGLDGPSRLARNRMYWDGCQQWRPGERPFALHRNGFAGMARYAAFLWSGDVYSTWETLATHVPVAVNSGLSGIPFWGTDIGGFVPTKELTGELYVRWFQFASFCPLFRSHGRTWKLRLPWGWNTGDLGPDEVSTYTAGAANPDESELHNAAVEPICRQYLELRYRLLPYLYTAVHEAHVAGMPILRAMWLHYPDDPIARARGDQYLWGRDLLVAPVVEKGARSRRLCLPRGQWFDFWTEDRVEGGREVDKAVDLATLPLYVRAGAILPLGLVKQYSEEPAAGPLTLQVHPGADGAFTIYEDDGRTFDYRRGDWMGIETHWNDRLHRLSVRLASGSRLRAPQERSLRVRVAGSKTEREAMFTGAPLEIQLDP